MYDIISKNSNLSTFKDYLDKTGLDKVLQKKIPYNWTIYAPSNNAFENTPKELEKSVLKDTYYSKMAVHRPYLNKRNFGFRCNRSNNH